MENLVYAGVLLLIAILCYRNLLVLLLIANFCYSFLASFLNLHWFNNTDEVIIIIGIIYWLFKLIRFGRCNITNFKITLAIIIFCTIGFLSNLFSNININSSFLGMFLVIKAFLVYIIFSDYGWSEKDVDKIKKVLTVIFCCIILYGFISYFVPRLAIFDAEAKLDGNFMLSIFDHPGVFATFILFSTLYAFVYFINEGGKKYLVYFCTALICLILAGRFKSLFALGISCGFYLIKKKSFSKIYIVLLAALLLFLSSGVLQDVLNNRIEIYLLRDDLLSVPRWALYYYGFIIAIRYFPLGSGFSTYASYTSTLNYSQLYYEYELNMKYGFTPQSPTFLTDTYWPSIIGETGFIGVILVGYILRLIWVHTKTNIEKCTSIRIKILGEFSLVAFFSVIIESFFTNSFMNYRCYLAVIAVAIFNGLCANIGKLNQESDIIIKSKPKITEEIV
ncbi:Oligosaccharide repeat unit polymerase Wzy [Desulfosporosinus sp. I2]|uniref:hypothetical protein n=1 Tax=Desulfosporosinus sp. I2 TaxID=1617025 RepID=UPI0005EDD3A3|nr:hypothetical protein [Desulfosporosinus sp. I2]KJR46656.1 Oligosaccharide repeat unit polymerase Wzy [Desulfosporosinus sp. I2]